MFKFLREFGAETHADERLAERWHYGHVVAYGILILFYCGSLVWHLAAAGRHRRAAAKKEDELREPPRFV